MEIIKAPNFLGQVHHCRSVFLAGSIEMGTAVDWQATVEPIFANCDVTLLNPRRADWNRNWAQEVNNHRFYEQVNWELTALEKSTVIAMYFASGTMSPISLLELGIWLGKCPQKLVVYCPKDFARNANVDITCSKYGVAIHENFDNWILDIKTKLNLI